MLPSESRGDRVPVQRLVRELEAHQGRLEIGLGACVVLLLGVIIWAVFFRELARPRGRPGTLIQSPTIPAARKLA